MKNKKILVLDDEPMVGNFIVDFLASKKFEDTHYFSNYENAIIFFYSNWRKIDLCILDIVMPKKNGILVYEEFRNVNPKIKALFISGYCPESLRSALDLAINENANRFLRKPFSIIDLNKTINEMLETCAD
jgi:DNA-binding NtrC family response regulator